MKILKIRFKNLNSLVGDWSIDFTSPEYINDGIFAISGPTGAGKSTILDAICLGLYGCTPRLRTISKSTNEIMSRHTGECFAEVIFQVHDTQIRAHWSQQRAHRRSNGELQNPKHEISLVEGGVILSNQVSTSKKLVEEKTGMDFNRFTQSMLLAQGGFAVFLKASGSDRAPILEQITGTKIYSDISIKVYDIFKENKNILQNLESEMNGISLIPENEEEQIKEEVKDKEIAENSLKEVISKIDTAIKWITNIDELKNELNEISKNEVLLLNRLEEFKPQRTRLQEALRANEIEGKYSSLHALRAQLKDISEELEKLENQKPLLAKNLKNAEEQLKIAADKKENEIKLKDSVYQITGKIRILDHKINERVSEIEKVKSEIKKNLEKFEELTTAKKALESSFNALTKEIDSINLYTKNNSSDASLLSELAGVNANISSIKDLSINQKSLKSRFEAMNSKITSEKVEIEKSKQIVIKLSTEHNHAKEKVFIKQQEISNLLKGKSLDDIKKETDELTNELLKRLKVADYETERKSLEDDKPCPLCGSMHHPYASGNIPVPDEIRISLEELKQLIKKIDFLENKKNDLEKTERQTKENLLNAENNLALKIQNISSLELTLNEIKLEVENITKTAQTSLTNFNQSIKQYGLEIKETSLDALDEIYKRLTLRSIQWQQNIDNLNKFNQEIADGNLKFEIQKLQIEKNAEEKKSLEITFNNLTTDIKLLKSERFDLFGNKNADNEEKSVNISLKNAEEKFTEALLNQQSYSKNLKANEGRVKEQKELFAKKETDLNALEKNFREKLTKYNISTEEDFLRIRMTVDERNKLTSLAANIDNEKTQLDTQKKDREERLQSQLAKKITDEPLEALKIQFAENSRIFTEINEKRISLKEKLNINEDAKIRFQKVIANVNAQKLELNRWTKLSNLIGSSDGKKFRNFAQGLTFEIMVRYANQQLAKLSERYLLIRDTENPLDLNVIDNYQAGEIRSTSNLSGGESFIVSLALSLGLSKMSSKNVRVDSLFLDEGFGSLDDDTLETTMSTLANLHQDGKIIGVISHVGALQERINTRIIVKPEREGRSTISGPGCMKM